MKQFFKRLFCAHYFNKGTPLDPENRLGMRTFKCDKCGATKVKLWNFGIQYNTWRHHE